jgi:predicted Zn finger-like uncharacterized protein
VVVICPKCKTRLKVEEGKLTVEGSRFKCPRCSTFLLVKKPAALPKKAMEKGKILVAHSNPAIITEITSLLTENGYQTITATDGIDSMVRAIKELPFLTIIEAGLPKIYGFEVCKRLKLRPETKEIKFILVSSVYDKKRYKREPSSLYDADDYIEEHNISGLLIDKINTLKGIKPEEKEEKVEKRPEKPVIEKPEQVVEPQVKPETIKAKAPLDEKIEKAKRLARTIMSDIYMICTTLQGWKNQ